MSGVRRAAGWAFSLVLVATLLAAAGPARGQTITPITLAPKPSAGPTPADVTRQRLAVQGMLDGMHWSLSMQSSGARRGAVLSRVSEYLRQKPGAIRIVVAPDAPALDDDAVINVKEASVDQALKQILGDKLGYVVQDDGSIFVTDKEAAAHYVRKRLYEISEVLAALRLIQEQAAPRVAGGSTNGFFPFPPAGAPGGEAQGLMNLIKRVVTASAQWSEDGGPAFLDFHADAIMVATVTEDMHQQILTFCRSLLATARLYQDAAQRQLAEAESRLVILREQLTASKEAVRALYLKAGRDEYHLTPQAIFTEAAKAKPDSPKPEELLALADQIEAVKAAQQDVLARIEAQRRLIQTLWEEVNGIPPKTLSSLSMPFAPEGESSDAAASESPLSADAAATATANTAFACDLYPLLCKGDDNAFYSPFSISTALAMTWAGARGQTEQQMAKALHIGLTQEKLHAAMFDLLARLNGPPGAKKPFQLSIANALWGQTGFEIQPAFLDVTKVNYGAEMQLLDFAGGPDVPCQVINGWVAARTQDKIKDLLGPTDLRRDTRLVLTNAIYFKSSWLVPFNAVATQTAPFTLLGGKKVSAPMMNQDDHLGYFKGKDFQAVALEYAGRQLSMILLVPDKADGLPAIEKSLTAATLEEWISKMAKKGVLLSLPRFKMTCRSELTSPLETLGMTDAFIEKTADFSGIAPGHDLFISAAIHKAFIEVNEEGTEAAAATGIVISESEVEEFATVRADHPFLFLIRHNATGSLLFIGRVMNPAQ
jgi:serpin B